MRSRSHSKGSRPRTHTAFSLPPNPEGQLRLKALWKAGTGAITGWLGAPAVRPACDTACVSHTVGQASALCSRESELRQMLPGLHTGLPWAACDQHSPLPSADCRGVAGNALDSRSKSWFCHFRQAWEGPSGASFVKWGQWSLSGGNLGQEPGTHEGCAGVSECHPAGHGMALPARDTAHLTLRAHSQGSSP